MTPFRSPARIPFSRWLWAALVLIFVQLLVDARFGMAAEEKAEGKKAAISTSKTNAKKTAASKKSEGPSAPLPAELTQVEKTYQKRNTLEARFVQSSFSAMTEAKKESSGVVMVKRPDQFRWETLKPEKNLLVSDGKKYWFYTPPFEEGERGQVVIKQTREVQSELANQLLSGSFSKMKSTKIESIGPHKYRLHPAIGSAGTVKTAEIEIDPKKSIIQKVKLDHEGGNKVEITLSEVKLGEKIDAGFFTFHPPSGTDIIRE